VQIMSVLQKLFNRPPPPAPPARLTTFAGDDIASAPLMTDASDDLLDYVDDGDPLLHDPGEPPHWAPECGTPAYSTRHHAGA
jgi:hypothetical protein